MIDERKSRTCRDSAGKSKEFDKVLGYCLSLEKELDEQINLLEEVQHSDLLTEALQEHKADIRDFFQLDPQPAQGLLRPAEDSPPRPAALLYSNHQHFDRVNHLLSQQIVQQEDILEKFLNTAYKMEEKLTKYERMTQLFDYKKEFIDDRLQSLKRLVEEQRAEKARLEPLVREEEQLLEEMKRALKKEITALESVQKNINELEAEERKLDLQLEQAKDKNKDLLAQIMEEETQLVQQEVQTSRIHSQISKMRVEERKLIHDIQEIKGNIRVNVRIRPPIVGDRLASKEDDIVELVDSSRLLLRMPKPVPSAD